ncbi:MAG: PaaI family thioesterase [Rhizomicrobium sp.]
MSIATDHLDRLIAGQAEAVPVVKTLRLGLLDRWQPGFAAKRWEPAPELLNADGSLFGGYIAAMADQILAFAAMTVVPDGSIVRTINLGVQFLRVGKAHAVLAESKVVAQTRSLITVEAEFFREADRTLIAKAQAQQMVLPYPTA